MSAIHPHIRTLQALAAAFHGQSLEARIAAQAAPEAAVELQQCAYFAAMLRDGCRMAAEELEAEERERQARITTIPPAKGN